MSAISLSLITLWEKEQFLYDKLMTRRTLQCLFIQVSQVFTWEKFCRQCLWEISFPELGQDPTIKPSNHPHLSVGDERNCLIKKSCAIANRTKKKSNVTTTLKMLLALPWGFGDVASVHCTCFYIIRLTQKWVKDHIQSARDNKQSLCQRYARIRKRKHL